MKKKKLQKKKTNTQREKKNNEYFVSIDLNVVRHMKHPFETFFFLAVEFCWRDRSM